jgi:isopenicillin N synthase-like dioxygenase
MSEPSTAPFSKWREVAVFDARVLRSGGEARDRELRRLRQAVERWGFFELQGHGIETQHMHALFAAQRAFFALPDAQKLRLRRTETNARGYTPRELTKNQIDAKEILELATSQTQR